MLGNTAECSREKKYFCANVFTCHVKDNLYLDCLICACKTSTTDSGDGYDDENFNQTLVASSRIYTN